MGLLVYRLHLDVRLTQRDPAPTWKQNTARLNTAGHTLLGGCVLSWRSKFRGDLHPYGGEEVVGVSFFFGWLQVIWFSVP